MLPGTKCSPEHTANTNDRPGSDVTIELIIPSLDRLERLLETLLAVRRLYPYLSIRVALQGPDFRETLYAALPDDHNFVVDYFVKPGLIAAVNTAFRNSPAEFCIVLDDDAVPCDGWLEAHRQALQDPEVAYTFGREVNARVGRSRISEVLRLVGEAVFGVTVGADRRLYGRIIGWTTPLGFVFANFHVPGNCVINAPAEGNFGIRRKAFLDAGGYKTSFRGNCWGYGPELGIRLAKQGRYGRYVGDAVMIHRPHVGGGTRTVRGRAWYRDFVFNNGVFIKSIGPWAWIGAVPRLVRRYRG
jgi:hypothetical protein